MHPSHLAALWSGCLSSPVTLPGYMRMLSTVLIQSLLHSSYFILFFLNLICLYFLSTTVLLLSYNFPKWKLSWSWFFLEIKWNFIDPCESKVRTKLHILENYKSLHLQIFLWSSTLQFTSSCLGLLPQCFLDTDETSWKQVLPISCTSDR